MAALSLPKSIPENDGVIARSSLRSYEKRVRHLYSKFGLPVQYATDGHPYWSESTVQLFTTFLPLPK